jgi:hypothetical protein
MNVYCWHEFLADYTDGLAVVVASSEEEAVDKLLDLLTLEGYHDPDYSTDSQSTRQWGPVTVYPVEDFAAFVHGGA